MLCVSGQPIFFQLLFIYLLVSALGLHCGVWTFSNGGDWGYSLVVVLRLLIVVDSLVAEHGLRECGLSSGGAWA